MVLLSPSTTTSSTCSRRCGPARRATCSSGSAARNWCGPLEQVHAGETVVDATLAARVASAAARLDSGEFWPGAQLGLSQRESEVLGLIVAGLSNRAIASRLVVGDETVKSHVAGHLPQARRQRPRPPPSPRRCGKGSSSEPRRRPRHGLGLADPERENALLVGIIEAISAGPELGPLASSVARLIVEATATDVCFVHVLDDGGGALTLTGATPPFDRQVGQDPAAAGRRGERLGGQPPRARGAHRGQGSRPSVPVLPRTGRAGLHLDGLGARWRAGPTGLVGVLNVHTRQRRDFTDRDVRLLASIGRSSPGRCTRPGCTGGWRPGSRPRNGSPSRSSRHRKPNGAGWPATSTTGSCSGW